jgi:ferredoxin--NADP+ reductase
MSERYNATVIAREDINPQLLVLRIRPDGPPVEFEPGQFLVLGLLGSEPRVMEASDEDPPIRPDRLIRRAYSIASASVEQDYLEFYVTLVASGALTPRLFSLRPGSRLFVSTKPSGFFTLDRVPDGKPVVLIATGTGLAPYMSMLRTMLGCDCQRKFVVLHGARYSWDLGYRAELESLSRVCGNLTYIPSITRPDEDPHFSGITGRVQTLVSDGVIERESGVSLRPEAADVFLCGHPGMIEAVKELLLERGYVVDTSREQGTLHVEEYW